MLNRRIACLFSLLALFAGACTTDFSLTRLDVLSEGGDATLDAPMDSVVAPEGGDVRGDSTGDVPVMPMEGGACPAGTMLCEGSCLDLRTNPRNCGVCGTVCTQPTPAQVNMVASCAMGACGLQCTSGYGDCNGNPMDGCETLLTSNAGNCGTCGHACTVPAGMHAVGACTAGMCGFQCEAGYGDCNGNPMDGCEVNTNVTTAHCGGCGDACPQPANAHGMARCTAGTCGFQCEAGFADCDGDPANGCEASTRDDTNNCGACGNGCPRALNATPVCQTVMTGMTAASTCNVVCAPGFGDCDGNATNGCEQGLRVTMHCGACNNGCSGETPVCLRGSDGRYRCGASCATGQANCNGSCVDTRTDPDNCGACGTVCPARVGSARQCSNGTCGFACQAGFGDCDGDTANGCEANLATDPAHCGSCTTPCSPSNATGVCSGGACTIAQCAMGFGDCNMSAADGCEVSLASSPMNCGSCGRACTGANVPMPTCTAGACGGACAAGFGDCDMMGANGCEASLTTTTNCGACGTRCATGEVCAPPATGSGPNTCQRAATACSGGQMLCSGTCVNTATDATHCGGCTTVCPGGPNATAVCAAGMCGVTCATGTGNCDANPANGCETDTGTSLAHCGACGRACAARSSTGTTAQCQGGACRVTCAPGMLTCDSTDPNDATGCEVNPRTNTANCGRCGNACPSGATCVEGTCQCAAGQTLCGGACVNTQTDNANCGACDTACSVGGSTCQSGVCVCMGGQAQCGSGASAMCRDTSADQSNCGSCGNACPGTATCVAGRCTCPSGQTACGAACSTLQTDMANCGMCGRACPAGTTCTAGTCTCPSGQTLCGAACTSATTDINNCGTCGNVCPVRANAAQTCSAGGCGFTCSAGFANCDMNATNGCEINTRTDAMNCGACGTRCQRGATCVNGACMCPSSHPQTCGGACCTGGLACLFATCL